MDDEKSRDQQYSDVVNNELEKLLGTDGDFYQRVVKNGERVVFTVAGIEVAIERSEWPLNELAFKGDKSSITSILQEVMSELEGLVNNMDLNFEFNLVLEQMFDFYFDFKGARIRVSGGMKLSEESGTRSLSFKDQLERLSQNFFKLLNLGKTGVNPADLMSQSAKVNLISKQSVGTGSGHKDERITNYVVSHPDSMDYDMPIGAALKILRENVLIPLIRNGFQPIGILSKQRIGYKVNVKQEGTYKDYHKNLLRIANLFIDCNPMFVPWNNAFLRASDPNVLRVAMSQKKYPLTDFDASAFDDDEIQALTAELEVFSGYRGLSPKAVLNVLGILKKELLGVLEAIIKDTTADVNIETISSYDLILDLIERIKKRQVEEQ